MQTSLVLSIFFAPTGFVKSDLNVISLKEKKAECVRLSFSAKYQERTAASVL